MANIETKDLALVRKAIPKACFEKDWANTFACLFVAFTAVSLGLVLSTLCWMNHWIWLYPACWIITGTAYISFFCICHDCGHYTFSPSKTFDIVLGHLLFLPSLYPFYSWKYMHDAHHKHTSLIDQDNWSGNNVYCDTAWAPYTPQDYEKLKQSNRFEAFAYRVMRLYFGAAPPLHYMRFMLNPSLYRADHRKKVYASLIVLVAALSGISTGLFALTHSVFAIFHFWFLPAFVAMHWLAFYTFLHHTSEDMAMYDSNTWTPYKAQVESTLNCLFPRWISFLHFNIDIHIPHHIAVNIPCYNLRKANEALKASPFGTEIKEVPLTLAYAWNQLRRCKLWDHQSQRFLSFSERPS